MTYAKVIADSVYEGGPRLTTLEVRFHRFVLAEFNTHRVFSRNSASSRAIPFPKQVQRILNDLALPVVWPAEQKGMQGGDEIERPKLADHSWHLASRDAVDHAKALAEFGVHKSVTNRLLEPFMWHTVVVTSTAWENFFTQRCSPLAQPEIRVAAEAMREAIAVSTPDVVVDRQWHLPYIQDEDYDALADLDDVSYRHAAEVSAARCARVSYLTQDGHRDIREDLTLYRRLTTADPAHWSPLEHVATPWPENRAIDEDDLAFVVDGVRTPVSTSHLPRVGNLLGWRSLRTEVEVQRGQVTFR